MYCKKCGTEQKNGQKFCPKCGGAFVGVNKKSRANDLISPNKIGLITKVGTCIFVLCLLLIANFSVPIVVQILDAAIIYFAFMGIPIIKLKKTKAQYASTVLCVVLMLFVGWYTTNNSKNGFINNKSGSGNSGPHEVCIYNDVNIIGTNGYMTYDILSNNGNYGVSKTSNSGGAITTDVITIPNGKKWKYDRDESTAEGKFYSPQIFLYMKGDENVLNNYRSFKTRNASDVPIFRGGDKILIYVPLSISPREKMSLHLKICFIEADDEFVI